MKQYQIHNFKELESRRKQLRSNSTSAEATLWTYLRNRQLYGRKFRRQHSVGCYILDFYCTSERLAIELDGDPHLSAGAIEYDNVRTRYLSSHNIHVLRFENNEVFHNPKVVLHRIANCFKPK